MGEKVASESQLFEVSIKRGMQNGEMMPLIPLTLPGKGNKAPDMIILQTLPHPKFKRNRDDLFYQHKLSLRDALYGCQFILTHLDKRQLLVKLHPGDVSKLDQFKLIENEGMPKSPGSSMKGKLYIHLTVEFRDSLTVEECNVLKKVLPPKPSMQTANIDDCVETTLYDLKFEQEI